MQHLFDGYGMLAKFRFEQGRVWVSNRFVGSQSWKAFKGSGGKMKFSEFGTPVSTFQTVMNTIKHFTGLGQGAGRFWLWLQIPIADHVVHTKKHAPYEPSFVSQVSQIIPMCQCCRCRMASQPLP